MSISKSAVMRRVLLALGCAVLATGLVALYRQHLVAGFLLGFAGLNGISLGETDFDYQTRYTAGTFASAMKTGRSRISTLGWICHVAAYLCLAGALISWLALR